jgi:hypothetical protein
MSIGKSVKLFLADGTPGGLLTAEIMNWTGHVVAAPRSDLAALLKRPEAKRTGIYILLGDDPNSLGGTLAYIGEGDDVSTRLYQHARPEEKNGKDFWERAIIFTSKDSNLTKAHVRYVESRLIALAQAANRSVLVNSTAPTPLPLPEADVSDMEQFIAQMKIVLPVLGVNLLRAVAKPPARPDSSAATSDTPPPLDPVAGLVGDASPVFEMNLGQHGVTATAQEFDGEFTIHEGSKARMTESNHSYHRLWERLVADGTLVPTSGSSIFEFARPYVFASPSAAATIVSGRSANGRTEWKLQGTRKSYADWQTEGIDNALTEDPQ